VHGLLGGCAWVIVHALMGGLGFWVWVVVHGFGVVVYRQWEGGRGQRIGHVGLFSLCAAGGACD